MMPTAGTCARVIPEADRGMSGRTLVIHAPNRLQPRLVAVIAALAAAVPMSLDRDLRAAVAAVLAVACIAEARRKQDEPVATLAARRGGASRPSGRPAPRT